MLHARADVHALHAANEPGGHFPGEERVFGKVFEIASAKRIAFDVDARSQKQRRVLEGGFVAHRLPDFALEFIVPRAGEQRREG